MIRVEKKIVAFYTRKSILFLLFLVFRRRLLVLLVLVLLARALLDPRKPFFTFHAPEDVGEISASSSVISAISAVATARSSSTGCRRHFRMTDAGRVRSVSLYIYEG